ncbi:MAG: phosphoadenylyl-sulfate reductase [Rhodobacteraceae bacterium]|nr:phosphoadenylyl-sulfate reductase [Paracoccaceae bacterium]
MPLEAPLAPAAERAAELSARYRHHSATDVLAHALNDPQVGRIAMVSSFGAQSVALLHMMSVIDRSIPVIFLQTQMLFAETLGYQTQVSKALGLSDVRVIEPDRTELFLRDPDGDLHIGNPDACCALRKVEPLEDALHPFDAWITGRKRFHGGQRVDLEFFEADGEGRIKVNPLAHWTRDDVADYMINNRLPKHPLVAQGYPSLGCAPCTTKVETGEDERSGRWRGQQKRECGIHFAGGRPVRRPNAA